MAVHGNENDALGGAGTIYDFTTVAVSGKNFKYIVTNADTIFASLTDEKGNDMLALQGIGFNTLSTGMVIRALLGARITGYQLTSGSITLIL
tara:strand:- start:752 stop:1027 length:276 start_codon:yes stop_codon:yes gene_type:complete